MNLAQCLLQSLCSLSFWFIVVLPIFIFLFRRVICYTTLDGETVPSDPCFAENAGCSWYPGFDAACNAMDLDSSSDLRTYLEHLQHIVPLILIDLQLLIENTAKTISQHICTVDGNSCGCLANRQHSKMKNVLYFTSSRNTFILLGFKSTALYR